MNRFLFIAIAGAIIGAVLSYLGVRFTVEPVKFLVLAIILNALVAFCPR